MFEHCIFDGKRMVVPITDNRETAVPIFRSDWFTKLGLRPPTTMEELENSLKAFTERGPSISPHRNTYGISSTNDSPWEVFSQVYAYYGVPPTGWQLRNGRLVAGQICPEVLEALKHLNKWFNNGWIDPEFPLYNREKFQEIIGTGTFGHYSWQFQRLDPAFDIGLAALYAREPGALFEPYAPIRDRNGNPGKLYHGDPRSGNFFGISKTAASPKRAMMLLDYAASEEGYLRIRYGVQGTHYTVENGQMKWLPGWDDINRRTQEGMSIQYNNFVRREWADRMINKTGRDAFAIMNQAMVPNAPIYVTTPGMLEMGPLRTQLEYETHIKIITAPPGTNVDTIWNDFTTRWLRDVGGQRITDEMNAAYAVRR
jgi:putative aldouronate transport system substrate-binding protein